ncbi:hypothetical protein Nepgr_014068 [Nepenthes gracilis]|uniref:Leucine-rich repeat-containing N-terminal plant-type domain-containing protein n=1 Tax=Nepenthes gracilis TaxID=150966 RepID=A0AAD3SKD4_NEPGR|nr:hypothetical protein Nepgr_014068 [Nepenthes gracilis]
MAVPMLQHSATFSWLISLTSFFIISTAFLSFKSNSATALSPSNDADRDALLALKERVVEDPYGALNSWNESLHFCNWEGVSCSQRHVNRVVALDLGGQQLNQLHGTIPADIGQTLPNLLGLYLGCNNFTGPMPLSFPNASGLVQLDLSGNSFSGTLPLNLGSLKGVLDISLGHNPFEPQDLRFLTSLNNCSSLKALDVGNSNLRGGSPSSISNLSSTLQILIAGQNQISGAIPSGIGNLINLSFLALQGNSIEGEIPTSIAKLTMLQTLWLSGNRISGSIPSSIGNMTQLGQLYLDSNYLNGSLPRSLGNCQNLQLLILSQNFLSGVIPKEIARLPSISISFNLDHNSFTGPLPVDLQLEDVNYDNNNANSSTRNFISEECLVAAMSIGIACSLESPHDRMNMKNVVAELHAIREKIISVKISRTHHIRS